MRKINITETVTGSDSRSELVVRFCGITEGKNFLGAFRTLIGYF